MLFLVALMAAGHLHLQQHRMVHEFARLTAAADHASGLHQDHGHGHGHGEDDDHEDPSCATCQLALATQSLDLPGDATVVGAWVELASPRSSCQVDTRWQGRRCYARSARGPPRLG